MSEDLGVNGGQGNSGTEGEGDLAAGARAAAGAGVSRVPTSGSVLQVLSKTRLAYLGREWGLTLPPNATKAEQLEALVSNESVGFDRVLSLLLRDELKTACRAHGLDDSGRARAELAGRLIQAHGEKVQAPKSLFGEQERVRHLPKSGDIVQVRHRQWLVEEVFDRPESDQATAVELVCLDDDNQGKSLTVLWELELGAGVLQPEAHGLGEEVVGLDPPRHFGAYLHALKWSSVTATDPELFQSPLRAGIQLLTHQLTPLHKALSLPRANLFIADDTGLGKTIEAGLVLQELQLRQRVDFVVIICPASVSLQWRDEMSKKFGLQFEIYNRAFMGRKRRERGFGVNPWSTHSRFIISHQTVRRPEYRDPLLQHIGERAKKSLLILDEAHVAAPASASKYAIDSRITRVIRDIAPRFENRLFLSATPHNGHSNSFSALLEILDRQRFTRGVPISSVKELEPVMVRRLKEDLRKEGSNYPIRHVVQVTLEHDSVGWKAEGIHATDGTSNSRTEAAADEATNTSQKDASHDTFKEKDENKIPIGDGEPGEVLLAEALSEYTQLMAPKKGTGRLVFINLQKRLLSSVEAFARTLHKHVERLEQGTAKTRVVPLRRIDLVDLGKDMEEDEYGEDDEQAEEAAGMEVAEATSLLESPEGRARVLLDEMVALTARHRGAPDAKVLALLHWIRRYQCPAARIGGATDQGRAGRGAQKGKWTDRRVIIFTEYGDTKRYLSQILSTAIAGTDLADERILEFHGGMSDEGREEVQRAFNSPPGDHPVRILLATDAAREGVNLQGHCADLFHYDVPWNPARMEQRNGRIDRTLQPAKEVRCHYFHYPQRTEDLVLKKLVQKVETIQRELGSLSAVLMDRMAQVMEPGIDELTEDKLERAEALGGRRDTVAQELESSRDTHAKLKQQLERAGEILNKSKAVMDFSPELLKDAINVGLELSGIEPLKAVETAPLKAAEAAEAAEATETAVEQVEKAPDHEGPDLQCYKVPEMPDSWQPTLDYLRPPCPRDEPFWEWRKRPPQPVVFTPPKRMNSRIVHLHLEHPFVQRIMSRFRSQGYSAHDLNRVTVLKNRHDALVRVIAFGRLSLFGPGASRLHDQLVSVAARWVEGRSEPLKPFGEDADKKAVELLEQILKEAPASHGLTEVIERKLKAAAPRVFAELWPHIRDEADTLAHDAGQKLAARAREESAALEKILTSHRSAIAHELEQSSQRFMEFTDREKAQRKQLEANRRYWEERLKSIEKELGTEPQQITNLYDVVLHRLEPVGLVFLWPEVRG